MRPFEQLTARGQVLRLRRLAESALPAYGLAGARLSLVGHEYNTTFRVDAPVAASGGGGRGPYIPGRFLLRIHQRDHHDPRLDRRRVIESELAWLAALRADAALAVPEPVMTLGGDSVVRAGAAGAGERFCSLLRWLGGRIEGLRAEPQHLRMVGALMAQLHRHAVAWSPPPGFARVRWDWGAFFGDSAPYAGLGARGAWAAIPDSLRPALGRAPGPLREAMDSLGDGPDAFGLIHADLHLHNVLIEGGEARAIDFDDCGFGHWLYDMAVTLWLFRMRPDWPAYRDAFLAGYAERRPLPVGQLRYLDVFIAAREATIALWVAATARANPGLGVDLEAELAPNARAVAHLIP